MKKSDSESKIVVYLALIGLLFVCFLAIFTLFFDRTTKSDSDGSADQSQQSPEQETEKLEYDLGYGIKFDSFGYDVRTTNDDAKLNAVDCRKMSSSLRIEQTAAEDTECFEVTMKLSSDQYLIITTGNGFYEDRLEQYLEITDTGNGVNKLLPKSRINLPLERIYVSGFPTNFSGEKIDYSTGDSFVFYSGLVIKGSDHYAIKIRGDLDSSVKELLATFELE